MAASGEPSVEPLSTTMTSPSIPDLHSASFASFTTSATLAISLRQGRTTETFSVTAVRLSVGTLPKPVSVKLLDSAPQCWRIAEAAPYIPKGARRPRRRAARTTPCSVSLAIGRTRLALGAFRDDLRGRSGSSRRSPCSQFSSTSATARGATPRRLAPRCCGQADAACSPSPYQPDRIGHFLARLGTVLGMTMHENHGFDVRLTPERFAPSDFELERAEHFQPG